MNAPQITVHGPILLGEHPEIFRKALDLYTAAKIDELVPGDREDITEGEHAVHILDDRGQMLGVACFFDCGHQRVWLDFIYVLATSRRRGRARAMIEKILASSAGQKKLMFGTSPLNKPMISLGSRFGFKKASITYALEIK